MRGVDLPYKRGEQSVSQVMGLKTTYWEVSQPSGSKKQASHPRGFIPGGVGGSGRVRSTRSMVSLRKQRPRAVLESFKSSFMICIS